LVTILVLLIVGMAAMAGVTGWHDWQRRSNEAWLNGVGDLTPSERTEITQLAGAVRDRSPILQELKDWDRCVKRYRRDGAADALNDFNHHRAKPYWGHSGGDSEIEWVPGFEGICAPPSPPGGVSPRLGASTDRANFRELDQMGSEFEDASWRTGLSLRCERASRTYAATYNRALAKLDPQGFRHCRAPSPAEMITYRY
jgi:hypothetical protein